MELLRTLLKIQALSAVKDLDSKKAKILFLSEAGLSGKEIALIDEWVGPSEQESFKMSNHLPGSPVQRISVDNRHLRMEIAMVGTRRLKEVLYDFRKAGQCLGCDYTRLAFAFLIERLFLQLRTISEKVSYRTDPPDAALAKPLKMIIDAATNVVNSC